MHYSHIFGPVHSRRLGRSLGIDLVPCNVCSYDCVYCECGHTIREMREREFFPSAKSFQRFRTISPGPLHWISSPFPVPANRPSPFQSVRLSGTSKRHFPNTVWQSSPTGLFYGDRRCGRPFSLPMSCSRRSLRSLKRPGGGSTGRHQAFLLRDHLQGSGQFPRGVSRRDLARSLHYSRNQHQSAGTGSPLRAAPGMHPDRVQLNTLDRPGTEESGFALHHAEDLERIRAFSAAQGSKRRTGPVSHLGRLNNDLGMV